MASNNELYISPYGNSLDLFYEMNPITASQSDYTADSKLVGKYANEDSLIQTSIFRSKTKKISQFVRSTLNQPTDELLNQTSLTDIIQHLQKWNATYLTYADFAYLKNLGVYPTNRLVICRRFPSPVGNNLYQVDQDPMATIVSWIPDNAENFFKISFGEVWEENGEGSFTSIVSSIGKDFGFTKDAGEASSGGFNLTNMSALTEELQKRIAELLGLKDEDDDGTTGNPTVIKEAKRRKIVPKNEQGSGLNSSFSITVDVEYEQKYINGVDPSLIYLDIIQKALVFGTAQSTFLFNVNAAEGISSFAQALLQGNVEKMKEALKNFYETIEKVLEDLQEKNKQGQLKEIIKETLTASFLTALKKYRTSLFVVIQALTGAPSGYFHVTIGNPKRPVFSSGDLICSDVDLTLGKTLGYNDLPSSIKLSFTLKPARNLGGQEIFDRLNTGQGRTYHQFVRSYIEAMNFSPNQNLEKKETIFNKKLRASLDSPGFGGEGNPGPQ